ncbi:MAG: hypothetical protein L6305_05340 [Actinomycetia bacterium]|nr:hypothetical protein [Actinomycetes bacterium]
MSERSETKDQVPYALPLVPNTRISLLELFGGKGKVYSMVALSFSM